MGTFTKLTYHVVFGTEYRRPMIHADIQERLYEYVGGRKKNGHLIEVGGVADHIHLLIPYPANDCCVRFHKGN